MPKKNHKPLIFIIILVVLVAAIGGYYYIIFGAKKSNDTSSDTGLTQIIQNQNADEFLKMFDSETTKSSLSKIGAKSILLDWNQNSTEDISKIEDTLKNSGRVSGAENDYRIKYIQTKKMLFFKDMKLTTMTSKLVVPSKLKKANITVDGTKVNYSELTRNNLFPGVYNFKIKLGKNESTQRVIILGDGRSVTLTAPKQKVVRDDDGQNTGTKKTTNNTQTVQTPKDDTSANDASNDPTYKEPSLVGADDLAGNWKLVDSKNNEMGIMPETITFSRDSITAMYAHNIQTTTPIDTVQYSEEDDTDYFTGDNSPNPFAAKLAKRTINGKERVVLEHLDQGSYGWYLRQ